MISAFQFENVARPWLWFLLVALGAWLLYVTYRGIFERSGRRLTWILLLLRASGILALLLALAKPALIHRRETIEPGRLAIVLDNSLSMSLADSSGKPRYAVAREAIRDLRQAVEAGRDASPLQIDLFDISGNPVPGNPPDKPLIERTDLAKAIAQTAIRLRAKPLAGIVLVSDGADTTGQPDLTAIRNCPVPVHTVGFHDDPEANRLDLAVRRIQAPNRVIINNSVKAAVHVSKSAGPALEATVTIKRGTETLATQKASLSPGRTEQIVNVTFIPAQAGHFIFTASIAAETGERLLANNAQHFPLQVESEPIRVFYIEGFLRYEYKYLKARLEEDPDVSLVSVVRRANPGRVAQESAADLITPERLDKFDVVILGDMEGSYLTESEYQAIVHWVDQGHALLVLGGYRSFGASGFRGTPLADILPVIFADREPYQSEEQFVLQVTPEGLRHPMFEMSGDRVKDANLWSSAPALLGAGLVRQAKPAADVLAVDPAALVNAKPLPVVVVQRYGAGHTLVLGVDTTWRWSRLTRVMGQADTLFARFWSQTIRWLSGRTRIEERPLLTLSTDEPEYDVGKPVTLRATRQAKPDESVAQGAITVEIIPEGGQPVSVPMEARSKEPDTFTGTYVPSAGGRFEVVAVLNQAGNPVANQTTEFMVRGSGLELADPRVNTEQLQAIAGATGGAHVNAEEAATLAGKIEHRERRTVQIQRREFWNSPLLFLFFLAAVTAEWILRRRNHLV